MKPAIYQNPVKMIAQAVISLKNVNMHRYLEHLLVRQLPLRGSVILALLLICLSNCCSSGPRKKFLERL
ncbi:hypothetical protein OnM2_058029 [Erysiphe neolycopersici]|uniref:Uncharacterized protein n=1 Tax=Erysiphe neolycopersici TaxID=212602 RepID=A0A420HQH6_9PEZI|nr:hypothetical protein OnM2_058029 [Erysiphe neolycopersici]